jgi:hypothetical protein
MLFIFLFILIIFIYLFFSGRQAAVESIQQNASSGKKKDHKALEQQFSVLYQNIQLFLRSAEEVTGTSLPPSLSFDPLEPTLTPLLLFRFGRQRGPAATPARHTVHGGTLFAFTEPASVFNGRVACGVCRVPCAVCAVCAVCRVPCAVCRVSCVSGVSCVSCRVCRLRICWCI